MGKINYLVGDATAPDTTEKNGGIICHVCNDEGKWGSGFVLAVSKKWALPEQEYRKLPKSKMKVGNYQMVVVGNNLFVANIIGQSGLRYRRTGFDVPAVDYAAIDVALHKIVAQAESMNLNLHMPRIASVRSGGSWEIVELIINRILRNREVDVYVYDLPNNDDDFKLNL